MEAIREFFGTLSSTVQGAQAAAPPILQPSPSNAVGQKLRSRSKGDGEFGKETVSMDELQEHLVALKE